MRFNVNTVVLVLLVVLLIVLLIPGENRNTLTAGHTFTVPGLGTYQNVPFGTYALIGWLLTALLYTLINSFSRLRSQADNARILRDMEGLRANLDKAEGSRFAELHTYLDRRLNELQSQVTAQTGDVGSYTSRVDRVRDELAADIGELEHYLKRKLGE
ncbi:LapA family protein [Deinococcus sonorensis]|uniref:LapA family protein n=2 Tax=Deinococcus sonorensis TaxID=309891 RepID=A0AAU7UDR3_9DEIO